MTIGPRRANFGLMHCTKTMCAIEIGVKQDIDAVVDIRVGEHSCAELLSNAAMGAVGGDDVGRDEKGK